MKPAKPKPLEREMTSSLLYYKNGKPKFAIDELSGCWNWTASKHPLGYGITGKCVNPTHLDVVSLAENIQRSPRSKLCKSVTLVVPLIPPSVNGYVRHTRSGRHYVTKEALAFKEAVALVARRRKITGDSYQVKIAIYLGKGDRGDLDNFGKVIFDSIVAAGVIHSDAAVNEIFMQKFRDPLNPRTVIEVEAN